MAEIFGVDANYKVLKRWQLWFVGLVDRKARDAVELLARYAVDNIFVSDKFKQRFPDFAFPTLCDGFTTIRHEASGFA